ncbi:MAG: protein kinase [Myxococcota bacterium]
MQAPAKFCPLCGTRYGHAATFCQKDGAQLSAEAAPDPYVGRVILGQFRVEEAIGAGGMGTVYRAHQTTLGRDVAVKILHPELAANPDAVRRFHREARVATKLEHPNLVRVLLFGEMPDHGGLYLVMEYLEGKSLTQVLREDGALQLPRALHVATQICDAVGVAHAQGVVHRDVKPENIMLVRRHGDPDFVKVLDFGIARLLWDEQTALTQSGVIFGTARYISPEGASGEHTDARSDVYSISVLIYQLLAGATPFDATTPVAMLMKHINDHPTPLRSTKEGRHVPEAVADVVMRGLQKSPARRYADASELAAALREAAEVSAITLPGQRGSWVPRRSMPSSGPIGLPPQVTPTMPVRDPAPDPAHDPGTAELKAAGLGRRPRLSTMAFAFIFGAMAVVGGAMAFRHFSGPSADDVRADLLSRAQEALAAGHLDAPPGENVLELSSRLLEANARDEGATELRREAVLRLREQAARARTASNAAEARRAYERILVFMPGDPDATDGLHQLDEEAARAQRPTPGLVLTPDEGPVGDAVTFVATTTDEDVNNARFEIWSGRRRLRRVPAGHAVAGRYVGSYTFRRSGRYEVRFLADGIPSEPYRAEFRATSRRRPAVARESTRADPLIVPTPQPAPPAVMTNDDEGIDWSLPGMAPAPQPTMMNEPPAPWTGSVI